MELYKICFIISLSANVSLIYLAQELQNKCIRGSQANIKLRREIQSLKRLNTNSKQDPVTEIDDDWWWRA